MFQETKACPDDEFEKLRLEDLEYYDSDPVSPAIIVASVTGALVSATALVICLCIFVP